MNINLLKQAKGIIRERRLIAEERESKAIEYAMKIDAYRELDDLIRHQILEIARNSAQNIDTSELESVHTQSLSQMAELKKNLKIPDNFYFCKLCNDIGQTENGEYCMCLKSVYNELVRKSSGVTSLPKFTFKDNFIENIECSQKDLIKKLYCAMEKYCREFPDNKYRNILIHGQTGVGKSCILSAIANELIMRNFTVQYLTSFALNNLLLKYHTSDAKERYQYMESLLNSDILILDDLGTEPILKNITLEYLYSILEARKSMHTLISTNLTPSELLSRYGERIFSRMSNKQTTKFIGIIGDDLRLKR